jgi:hypothetical protein
MKIAFLIRIFHSTSHPLPRLEVCSSEVACITSNEQQQRQHGAALRSHSRE